MTTVAQLIEYLQTLPPETAVGVAVSVDGSYASYTSSEALELPTRKTDGSFWECSDNMGFYSSKTGQTFIFFGRT